MDAQGRAAMRISLRLKAPLLIISGATIKVSDRTVLTIICHQQRKRDFTLIKTSYQVS